MARPNCEISSDCTVDGVLKNCYALISDTEEENVCECSNLYGFTGPNCDEISPQVRYYKSASLILTVLMVGTVGWLATELIVYCKAYYNADKGGKKNLGKNWIILVCTFLGLVAGTVFEIMTLRVLFSPEDVSLGSAKSFFGDEIEEVISGVGPAYRFLQYSFFTFVAAGAILISFSWIDVAESVPYFADAFKYKKAVNAFKKVAGVIVILYLVSAPVMLGLQFYLAFSYLSIFLSLVLIVVFGVGWHRFKVTFESVCKKRSDPGKNVLQVVQRCSLLYSLCLLGLVLSSVVFGVLTIGIGATIPPGKVNPAVVAGDVTILFTTLAALTNAWYLSQVLSRMRATLSRATPTHATGKTGRSVTDTIDHSGGNLYTSARLTKGSKGAIKEMTY